MDLSILPLVKNIVKKSLPFGETLGEIFVADGHVEGELIYFSQFEGFDQLFRASVTWYANGVRHETPFYPEILDLPELENDDDAKEFFKAFKGYAVIIREFVSVHLVMLCDQDATFLESNMALCVITEDFDMITAGIYALPPYDPESGSYVEGISGVPVIKKIPEKYLPKPEQKSEVFAIDISEYRKTSLGDNLFSITQEQYEDVYNAIFEKKTICLWQDMRDQISDYYIFWPENIRVGLRNTSESISISGGTVDAPREYLLKKEINDDVESYTFAIVSDGTMAAYNNGYILKIVDGKPKWVQP